MREFPVKSAQELPGEWGMKTGNIREFPNFLKIREFPAKFAFPWEQGICNIAERPKYQGVVEFAILAMTPAQLLLFQSKEECTNVAEITTQCKNVQVQSVKLLGEMKDEATMPTSSTEVTTQTSSTQKRKRKNRIARVRRPFQQTENVETWIETLTKGIILQFPGEQYIIGY